MRSRPAAALANGLSDHPSSLVQILVGASLHELAANAISAGCQRHAWSEPQLIEFQQQLDQYHAFTDFRAAMRAATMNKAASRPNTSA